jgi:hypothetical protein
MRKRRIKVVIEESNGDDCILNGYPWYAFVSQETYHIRLSSITVILWTMKIFECWSRIVSKNKKSFTLIRHGLYYNDLTLWQEALKQSVINVAKLYMVDEEN